MKKNILLLGFFAFAVLLMASADCHAATYAYIPNEGDLSLSVIQAADDALYDSVANVGNGPNAVAVGYDGKYVFIANSADNALAVVKVANIGNDPTGSDPPIIKTVVVGTNPLGLAADPSGDYVYAANYDSGTVSVVETDGDDIALLSTKSIGGNPLGIAVTNDGDVFVADNSGNTVRMFNATKNIDIVVGNNPYGVAVSPDGKFVYVSNYGSDSLSVIRTNDDDDDDDDEDNEVIASMSVGGGPKGVTVAGGGQYVCVVNSLDNTVSILEVEVDGDDVDLTLADTIAVDSDPVGISAPMNGEFAYVTYAAGADISRIDFDGTLSTVSAASFDSPRGFGRFVGGAPPEAAPDELEAEAKSESKIQLTWQNNAWNVLGFKIERCTSGDDEDYEQIAMVTVAESYDEDDAEFVYNDGGRSPDTTYYYRIRAYSEAADSDYSDAASATTSEEEEETSCFIRTSEGSGGAGGLFAMVALWACVCFAALAGAFINARRGKALR